MNQLWNLIKKELRELLTPSSLASVIVMVIVFMALGSMIKGEIGNQTEVQAIGYADFSGEYDGTDYSDIGVDGLKQYYFTTYNVDPEKYVINLTDIIGSETDSDKILKAMNEKGLKSCLILPSTFDSKIHNWEKTTVGLYWNQTSTSVFSTISTVTGATAVSVINSSISTVLIEENSTMTAEQINFAKSPAYYSGSTFFNGGLHEGVSPDQIYSAMSSQTMFVPIIIMLIIVMIGSILISSMGNEKENKTLETLLTLPVGRTTIVAGKLIGSAIAGLVMGALYMVGMYFYISGITTSTSSGGVSMESLGLSLSIVDWVIVAAFMFLAILCALGMCMILGAFAKNYKAAQMYIMPISVLAMIPMFVTMFSSYSELPAAIQAIMFAIPFTHPMMIMQNLMFDNTAMIIGGFVYLAVFAAAMIYITVRLYKSDILLTGIIRKKNKTSIFAKRSNKNNE
jgi:ABC-2 type transport system permease protein